MRWPWSRPEPVEAVQAKPEPPGTPTVLVHRPRFVLVECVDPDDRDEGQCVGAFEFCVSWRDYGGASHIVHLATRDSAMELARDLVGPGGVIEEATR